MAVTDVVRKIIEFPRDEDGLFIQPDELTPELAVVIEHNRQRMASKWDYADEHGCGNGRTLDLTGKYNCGGCNQENDGRCLAVYDDSQPEAELTEPPLEVNPEIGSCGKFENIDPGDPELAASRLPASVANYGEREGGDADHVFGCAECPFAAPSKWPVIPSAPRPLWCGKGASTVTRISCCTINGAPTVGKADRSLRRHTRRVREWVMQASKIKVSGK